MNATQGGANLHPGVNLQPGANLHPGANCAYEHGFRMRLHNLTGVRIRSKRHLACIRTKFYNLTGGNTGGYTRLKMNLAYITTGLHDLTAP